MEFSILLGTSIFHCINNVLQVLPHVSVISASSHLFPCQKDKSLGQQKDAEILQLYSSVRVEMSYA
jgi:hypothetical protein